MLWIAGHDSEVPALGLKSGLDKELVLSYFDWWI